MKPTLLLRCTAVLMVIFAIGHTTGFLTFRPRSAEGMAVWNSMNAVTFTQGHAIYTYGGFYTGFGLFITIFQVFIAWLSWWLGSSVKCSVAGRPVIAALCLLEVVGAVLSFRYFSMLPVAFSIMAVVLLASAYTTTKTKNIQG